MPTLITDAKNFLLPALMVPVFLLAQGPTETLILRDGTQFTGKIISAGDHDLTFRGREGDVRHFGFEQVQSIQFNTVRDYDRGGNDREPPPPPPAYPPPGARRELERESARNGYMTILAGAEISIRTNEGIDSRDPSDSRSYSAEVARDIVDSTGRVAIPRGSEARLLVRSIGNNQLALDLQSVAVNGQRYTLDTGQIEQGRQGLGSNKRTGEFVGGGAALGAIIGAIAGGGKGAGIGALAGGAAGAVSEVATKGDHVHVPAESVLNFRLDSPLLLQPVR